MVVRAKGSLKNKNTLLTIVVICNNTEKTFNKLRKLKEKLFAYCDTESN